VEKNNYVRSRSSNRNSFLRTVEESCARKNFRHQISDVCVHVSDREREREKESENKRERERGGGKKKILACRTRESR